MFLSYRKPRLKMTLALASLLVLTGGAALANSTIRRQLVVKSTGTILSSTRINTQPSLSPSPAPSSLPSPTSSTLPTIATNTRPVLTVQPTNASHAVKFSEVVPIGGSNTFVDPGPATLPFILTKASMNIPDGSYDLDTGELSPRGNPDGTVSDAQILCNATNSTANGRIYAIPWGSVNCSNIHSFAVFVKPGTPPGTYILRVIVTSRANVRYYGDIHVTVYNITPPPIP